MVFAYAVSVGEKTYCVDEQNAILVTISDEMNIVIPASTTSTANYLDINISQIKEIIRERRKFNFQSRSSTSKLFEVLTIGISKSSEEAYYFNARGFFADSINLVFISAGAASTVQQRILSIKSRIACNLEISQSEPLDISQQCEDFDARSATQQATQLSVEPCNDLAIATRQANETSRKSSIDSVAHLSPSECDESPLERIHQSLLKTSVASRHGGDSPQLIALIDSAMSPVELHQFDELSLKLTTVEYSFEDSSSDELPSPAKKLGEPSLSESCQGIWDRQLAPVNSYGGLLANGYAVKIPSIEHDEHHDSLYHAKPGTYTTLKKPIDQANPKSYERVNQREASRVDLPPNVNEGKLGRQGLTKLSQRMRRNVGEPPVGLSIIPKIMHGDATKIDERKREDLRPALKKNLSFSDRKPRDLSLSKVRSKGPTGGNSKAASMIRLDRCEDEFDFPISAKKAPKVSTVDLPARIAIMCASDRQPSTQPISPPKPILKRSSKRPEVRIHDEGRPKAITGTTASIPSKRIRNQEEDDAIDPTNCNAGLDVDQAKESEVLQRQRKKQLNRKSQPRTKRIRAKDDLAFSTHKAQNPKINKSIKQRAVPVPLAQSRSRRIAALTANRKIQGLIESAASEDEEDFESLHEKGKSITRLDRENRTDRTPTSHASILTKDKSGERNANSRPTLITPRKYEARVMKNHGSATITSALPRSMLKINESEKVGRLDSVDLASELLEPPNGLINGTNTRQRLPVNGSDTPPLDGRSARQLQSELPSVKLKMLEIQDSASTADNSTLQEQGLVHDNTMPVHNFAIKIVTPEVHASDRVDALDDIGGGFFEEATAFSHEDNTRLMKNHTEEGIANPPILDSNFENIHDANACEEGNVENISRAAHTSTNIIKSTPKVSLAAKLQSALSGVKNSHFPTKRVSKLRGTRKKGALPRTEVTSPLLGQIVCDKMAANGSKETIVSYKPAVGPNAVLSQQSPANENGAQSLKKTVQSQELQPSPVEDLTLPLVTKPSHRTPPTDTKVDVPRTTPYTLGAANFVKNGGSNIFAPVNEVSLQRIHRSPKSLRLDPDSRMINAEACKRNPEGRILSAIRINKVQHGLQELSKQTQELSKQKLGPAEPANLAPKSKPGAVLFEDEVVHAEKRSKTPLDSDRKPNVISFDSKGPRNQGVVSSQIVRPIQAKENQKPEFSGYCKDKTLKRTIQDFSEDSFGSGQQDAVVKRPRTSMDVPPILEKAPERVQKRSISIVKESAQKPSSQSTRVDKNGSPLPFVHFRKINLQRNGRQIPFETAAQSPTAEKGAEDGNGLLMSKDRLEILSPGLSFPQDPSPPSPLGFRFVPSSYTKHRPSSPNAPSGIIAEYTAHKVDSSGKFVNIRTDNVVMAVRPPDPFVGIQRNHQNKFTELLRRSSNIPDKGSSAIGPSVNEDLAKTLVNGGLAQEKNNSDTASSSSSSSDSSRSNKHSQPEDPSSSEGGGDEEDDWAAALQPHQCETLGVLFQISHVSQAAL